MVVTMKNITRTKNEMFHTRREHKLPGGSEFHKTLKIMTSTDKPFSILMVSNFFFNLYFKLPIIFTEREKCLRC